MFELSSEAPDSNNLGTSVLEKEPEVKEPPLYQVILLNDDYTPMEFVVDVIQKVFKKSHDEATKIMLQIHTEGIGICGIFPLEIAETKMNQVLNLSKESQHPLQCIIEKI